MIEHIVAAASRPHVYASSTDNMSLAVMHYDSDDGVMLAGTYAELCSWLAEAKHALDTNHAVVGR